MKQKNITKRRQYAIQMKDVIPKIAKNINNAKLNINIALNWQQIVGAEFAKYLTPTKIQSNNNKKTLWLKCTHGAEINMSYSQNEIITRINRYLGTEKIHNIRLLPDNKKSPQIAQKRNNSAKNKDKIQSLKNLAKNL